MDVVSSASRIAQMKNSLRNDTNSAVVFAGRDLTQPNYFLSPPGFQDNPPSPAWRLFLLCLLFQFAQNTRPSWYILFSY